MADLKRLTEDATTKAALAAGKDAAKRALDDLLLTDEEKTKRDATEVEDKKSNRWKYLAIAVLGICLAVGFVGLMLSYWQWFLLAGVFGVAGLYAYWRLRKSRKKEPVEAALPAKAAKAELEEPKARVAEAPRLSDAERLEAAATRARQQAEARAEAEQAVDDELAAMKARLKK